MRIDKKTGKRILTDKEEADISRGIKLLRKCGVPQYKIDEAVESVRYPLRLHK